MICTPAAELALTTRSASDQSKQPLQPASIGAPLEERLLPAEAQVGDELEVAAGGVRVAPQEDAHAVVGAGGRDGCSGRRHRRSGGGRRSGCGVETRPRPRRPCSAAPHNVRDEMSVVRRRSPAINLEWGVPHDYFRSNVAGHATRIASMPVDSRLPAHVSASGSDEAFVDAAFAVILRRPPDAEARQRALEKLAEGRCRARRCCTSSSPRPSSSASACSTTRSRSRAARGARRAAAPPAGAVAAPTSASSRCRGCSPGLGRGRVLEVGWAFAEPAYLAALVEAAPGELVGVDLAEARRRASRPSSPTSRKLPFPDDSFDQVLLVSTLEHIGADNEIVRGRRRGRPVRGRELRSGSCAACSTPEGSDARHRAARRAGRLRLVPAGGRRRLDAALHRRRASSSRSRRSYELGEEGWRSAPTFDPEGRHLRPAGPCRVGRPLRRAQPAPAAPALRRRDQADGAAAVRAVVPPPAGLVTVQAVCEPPRRRAARAKSDLARTTFAGIEGLLQS